MAYLKIIFLDGKKKHLKALRQRNKSQTNFYTNSHD